MAEYVWNNTQYKLKTQYPQSWDAYAFRPPLPKLRADYLTPAVFMNMCNAENRAGAALFLAGLAGQDHNITKLDANDKKIQKV